jgi:hypothetical protein
MATVRQIFFILLQWKEAGIEGGGGRGAFGIEVARGGGGREWGRGRLREVSRKGVPAEGADWERGIEKRGRR